MPVAVSVLQAQALLKSIPQWKLDPDQKMIFCELIMRDFLSAIELIQAIARIAEAKEHHPDLHLTAYRRLRIELSTHSMGGLSELDFSLAAEIDHLPKRLKTA